MIVKRGKKYVVMDSTGTRVLGSHPTESSAKAQLYAIEMSKKRRKAR